MINGYLYLKSDSKACSLRNLVNVESFFCLLLLFFLLFISNEKVVAFEEAYLLP